METMYRCTQCGAEFEEPRYIEERDPSYEGGIYGSQVCPDCGSDDIEEGAVCGLCNMAFTDGEFCEDCKREVWARLMAIVRENFTDAEINALGECSEEHGLEEALQE